MSETESNKDINNDGKRKHKVLKKIIIALLSLIGVVVLIVGGYVVYVVSTYKRIGNVDLEVKSGSSNETISTNSSLTVTSYNIGFGAYSSDYTFFMDSGIDQYGNKTKGEYAKARSKEEVIKNTNGVLEALDNIKSDFYLLQEVDIDSDRAYHIDQSKQIEEKYTSMDSSFCINYNSAKLLYPFNDPIGKTKSGIQTLSSYTIQKAERKEYTISTGFSKFFDLDRCFSVNKINVSNGKELILINSHMSAYDEGGVIRNKQLQELNEYMLSEYQKGNYVVVGGDFNHDLLTNNPLYPEYTYENFAFKDQTKQLKPDWLNYMFNENKESNFDSSFTVYAADNEPTCRDTDVVYTEGFTFVSTLDGFVVSDNVSVTNIETTRVTKDNAFAYTDHQPTTLTFLLND